MRTFIWHWRNLQQTMLSTWLRATVHSSSILGTTPWYLQFSCTAGVSSQVEAVQTMVDRMKTALEEAQANLTVAQSRAKSQVDRLRRDEKFEVGDEVVLSTCHISINQHLPSKLRRRWIGPYRVARVISLVAYKLDLPPTWRIHPVFHVSNLKRFH